MHACVGSRGGMWPHLRPVFFVVVFSLPWITSSKATRTSPDSEEAFKEQPPPPPLSPPPPSPIRPQSSPLWHAPSTPAPPLLQPSRYGDGTVSHLNVLKVRVGEKTQRREVMRLLNAEQQWNERRPVNSWPCQLDSKRFGVFFPVCSCALLVMCVVT